MRPGCYDAKARLEDMDRSGVLASLCFPTLPRFCGQLFMEASDREFGFHCLQIYNDWSSRTGVASRRGGTSR